MNLIKVNPRDLTPHPQNYHLHDDSQIAELGRSISDFGQYKNVVAWRSPDDGKLYTLAGHGFILAAIAQGITEIDVNDRSDLTKEQATALMVADIATVSNEQDKVRLATILKDAQQATAIPGVDDAFVKRALRAAKRQEEQALDVGDDIALSLVAQDVPDALWPSDNDWGVPLLDSNLQANAVDLPVNRWGTLARSAKMRGTYHFYTDDYKFEGLWRDPAPVVNAECVNIVEPNFSTNVQMPPAVALWHIYRKRWLARYWQSFGIRVFVDLAVTDKFSDLNLLGVPKGWKAYASYRDLEGSPIEWLQASWGLARQHAGTDSILMLVYAGGPETEAWCKEHGVVWCERFTVTLNRNIRPSQHRRK